MVDTDTEARNQRTPMDWRIRHLTTVESTNDECKALAEQGAKEGLVIIAGEQTRGRGRRGRGWVSFPGKGLYMSILLRPGWPASDAGWVAVLAGVAVAKAMESQGVEGVAIKWPNDVLLHGRKLAGILVEPRIGDGVIDFAVLGIGLNLTHDESDWHGTVAEGLATSCRLEGIAWTVREAADAVLKELADVYGDLHGRQRDVILSEWSMRGGGETVPPLQ